MAEYINKTDLLADILDEECRSEKADSINALFWFARIVQRQPVADVVPRSECEKWYAEYHKVKEDLKQEKMYHRSTEKLADRYLIELKQAKQNVAREIFEELDRLMLDGTIGGKYPAKIINPDKYTESKKKYIGE